MTPARRYTTSVGTEVEIRLTLVDDTTARITSYRRRPRGHRNFRRVPHEEGRLVRLDQLPLEVRP